MAHYCLAQSGHCLAVSKTFTPLVHCLSQCDAVSRHQTAVIVDKANCSAHIKLIMVCTFYLQSSLAAGSNTVTVINKIMFLKREFRAACAGLRPLPACPSHAR